MAYFIYQGHACYYEELGVGSPLLLLHGNTASSKMFEGIAEEYSKKHRVYLIDFLGHGRSERLERFPVDLWYDEAQQVITFLKEKDLYEVDLIGCSGGSLVAINVALEVPERIKKVIADSFEGEVPLKAITDHIAEERAQSKTDENAKMFYYYMQGEGWEQVVDNDTNAIIEHEKTIGKFFHKSLETLKADILLTGSKEDEFVNAMGEDYFEKTYRGMIEKIGHGELHLFEKGNHPAMLSSTEEFIEKSEQFLNGNE